MDVLIMADERAARSVLPAIELLPRCFVPWSPCAARVAARRATPSLTLARS